MPFLPVLVFFNAKKFELPACFFAALGFGMVILLTEKTIAALHFGTRKWTRSLWALLTTGLCPHLWITTIDLQTEVLCGLAFSVAAVFFSVKFLEDGDISDLFFPLIVAAAIVFLRLPVPVFLWMVLAADVLFFLKKKGWLPPGFFFEKAPAWMPVLLLLFLFSQVDFPSKNWDFARISPVLLPFWPIFGIFMPICLFFLKKTDISPLPKKWLAAATVTSVLAAVLWPFLKKIGLEMAWFGLVVLTFPVFERGLLYGLVFFKKWKIWSVFGFFLVVQCVFIWIFLHRPISF